MFVLILKLWSVLFALGQTSAKGPFEQFNRIENEISLSRAAP